MVTASFWTTLLALLCATSAVACASLWTVRWPRIGLIFLGLSVVLGQAIRFPLPGQGGGLLVSDVAVVLVLLSSLVQFYSRRQSSQSQILNYQLPITSYRLLLLFSPFIVWSIGSLVISSVPLSGSDFLVAGAYWVRLTTHLLLIPALLLICRSTRQQTYLARILIVVTGALAALGFMQLLILPHLQVIAGGWDPHVYRLVATWLDPNLIGGFFAVLLPWLVAELIALRITLSGKHPALKDPKRRVLKGGSGWSVFVLMTVITSSLALLLTQSRSSLVALGVGVAMVSPLVMWLTPRRASHHVLAAVGIGSTFIVVVIVAMWLLGDRAWGLVTFDQTVTLRLESQAAAWRLFLDHPVVGVGYNAYQFAAQQAGLISDFTVHSRAGADNSWLTLLVTTGVLGTTLFVLPWLWLLGQQLSAIVSRRNYQALAGLAGVISWLVHSQFVNSLLYAHLVMIVAMLIAVTWPTSEDD